MLGRKPEPTTDPSLGPLEHRRGAWRGTVSLDGTPVELAVPGRRSGPDDAALEVARTAVAEFAATRAAVVAALDEHRLILEAATPPADLAPIFVTVVTLERRLVLEFGYQVPWDDEHTLGARVHAGALVELCGSTLRP